MPAIFIKSELSAFLSIGDGYRNDDKTKVATTSITKRRTKVNEIIKMRRTTMKTLNIILDDDKTKTALTSVMTNKITMR